LNYNDLSIITLKELNFAVVFIQLFRGFRGNNNRLAILFFIDKLQRFFLKPVFKKPLKNVFKNLYENGFKSGHSKPKKHLLKTSLVF